MPQRHSLRLRVAFALAAFGAVVSIVLSTLVYLAERDISRRLLDQTLAAEMDDYLTRLERNPRSLPPNTATLRGYVGGAPDRAPPAAIADLRPGAYDVELDGAPFRALIRTAPSARIYLLFSEARHRAREQRFALYLASAALIVTLLSAVAGLWLTGRIVRPVTDLAKAVRDAAPDRPPELPGSGREDEVDELSRAFDRYAERLHAFVDRERAFAADASHELRTPLAVISGAAEVLADDDTLTIAQRSRFARIQRAVSEMTEVTSALLLLSREETDRSMQSVPVDRVIERVVSHLAPAAAARGMRIETTFDARPCVAAHESLLGIVLGNLLRNAIAHSVSACVRIRLGIDVLEVVDSGVGMPPEALARVFDRGYRGPQSEGAGIGLALVRRICERMRWRLSIESREGAGTTAVLHF